MDRLTLANICKANTSCEGCLISKECQEFMEQLFDEVNAMLMPQDLLLIKEFLTKNF